MRRTKDVFVVILLFAALLPLPGNAAALRIGVLEFGTVNWELDVIRHHALAQREGVDLKVMPLASKEAASVAMQADAVDVIVTDWFWVARQRHAGEDFTFVPHSMAVGALMVHPGAGLRDIEDLRGQRIGIAGGPDDKSWLLLRAWALQETGRDIAAEVETVFGAPPLLNALLMDSKLPAVLNYWHYNARLAAAGMQELLDVESLLPALGITSTPPLLGWTFRESFAEKNPKAIEAFLQASRSAKETLRSSDEEWKRLQPLMEAGNESEFRALRDHYRRGIPRQWNSANVVAAEKTWSVIATVAEDTLTGGETTLAPGTFWLPAVDDAP